MSGDKCSQGHLDLEMLLRGVQPFYSQTLRFGQSGTMDGSRYGVKTITLRSNGVNEDKIV
jgi:hypothetical protein